MTTRVSSVDTAMPKMSEMEEYGGFSNPRLIYNLGHAAVHSLMTTPVQAQEKVDGSFFAFGAFGAFLAGAFFAAGAAAVAAFFAAGALRAAVLPAGAAFAATAALLFAWYSRHYKMTDNYRTVPTVPGAVAP